jgi:hypothetical protein
VIIALVWESCPPVLPYFLAGPVVAGGEGEGVGRRQHVAAHLTEARHQRTPVSLTFLYPLIIPP